uniref:Auxin-responsive protein n=1 Tax=Solanum lycopersicum TaxID=4081 RepID=A0A3Q7IHS4_SOLLC
MRTEYFNNNREADVETTGIKVPPFVQASRFLRRSSTYEGIPKGHCAEEEFGFDHPLGGLTIPYKEDVFVDLASHLRRSRVVSYR